MSTPTKWTHKVVKKSRGMQGEWFAHRAAMTGDLAECIDGAKKLAGSQLTGGHRIVVLTRGGKFVQEFPGAAN